MIVRFFFVLVALAVSQSFCFGKDSGAPTFTTREEAGIDYRIQGEYEGNLGNNKWGAHVVATGNGHFNAIGYIGGLPGNGWTGERGQYVSGKLNDGLLKLESDNFYLTVDGDNLRVFSNDDTEFGALKKVERKSETLGKTAPENAVVLFSSKDSDSISNWENAKLTENKLLAATGCSTKQQFGDHTLHLEFMTPFMPASKGQQRGNSGVYVQSRYELQVLDSFGLDAKDNDCGGIYKVSKPKLNMCYPPLTWQTYDIDFTAAKWDGDEKTKNARIIVRHNGVIIHENLELPKHTPGRYQENPDPAALFLQDHGNPVVYRNIWVLPK